MTSSCNFLKSSDKIQVPYCSMLHHVQPLAASRFVPTSIHYSSLHYLLVCHHYSTALHFVPLHHATFGNSLMCKWLLSACGLRSRHCAFFLFIAFSTWGDKIKWSSGTTGFFPPLYFLLPFSRIEPSTSRIDWTHKIWFGFSNFQTLFVVHSVCILLVETLLGIY